MYMTSRSEYPIKCQIFSCYELRATQQFKTAKTEEKANGKTGIYVAMFNNV